MKIEFASHAGFIIEVKGKRIYIDPWTKSKTFNDGWALISEAKKVDYAKIDYIFVTHEHPDHFNFPTLKGIDENHRRRIKVLYQQHASLRLKNAFERLGFDTVVELPIYKWIEVEGIELFCGSSGSMDSFLAIRAEGQTILNLNDCVFRKKQYDYIQREIGNVDFLFTQFSFANWVGNEVDQLDGAEEKIREIGMQKRIFSPKYIIPFASFVYFCNEENARMNDWMNTPRMIAELPHPEIKFMYPSDEIDTKDPHFDSERAVQRYMEDLDALHIDPTPNAVSFVKIQEAIS